MLRLVSSVRVRITVAVSIVFGVALSLGAVGLVREVESALVNDTQVRNVTVSRALSTMLSTGQVPIQSLFNSPDQMNSELADQNDPGLREGIIESYIYVTGPALNPSSGDSLWSIFQKAASAAATPLLGKVMPKEMKADQYAISRTRIETTSGVLYLNVATPLEGIHSTVHRIASALLVAVPSLIAMVAAMTWFMTGRALRPVGAITNRVKEITGSTLHERVPEPRTDDEVGELARTMNAMLDRLEG